MVDGLFNKAVDENLVIVKLVHYNNDSQEDLIWRILHKEFVFLERSFLSLNCLLDPYYVGEDCYKIGLA